MMRVFGSSLEEDRDTPFELREASLKATPHELRILAAFLTDVAQSMDEHDADFGHEHFRDFCRRRGIDSIDGNADIIVAR